MQFQVIVVTDTSTHTETGPITLHCAAASAQCKNESLICVIFVSHVSHHISCGACVSLMQLGDGSDWWADLLQSVIYAHLDTQLVDRMKEDLLDNVQPDKINMAHKCLFLHVCCNNYVIFTVLIALLLLTS